MPWLITYRGLEPGEDDFVQELNGEEARLPLEPVTGPYYDWTAFKAKFAR